MTILQIAAVMGLTFRRIEVTCASEADKSETSRLLRYCRDEDVLELSEESGSFVHEVYHQYFLRSARGQDRTGIHERLADCLRVLRPAEYELRCAHALNAERPGEAAALAVHAALQTEREGRSWRELPEAVLGAIASGQLTSAVKILVAAMDDLNRYRFTACLSLLDSLPRDLPKSLIAERDYLMSLCLMSTRSEVERARGRRIVNVWDGYHEDEPEIGMRLMQLHLYGLTHLIEKGPARALEDRIQQVLMDRLSFDVAAKDALNTLDRCSGSIDWPETSLRRNRRATQYYGPQEGEAFLRRPVEYYRCLVNLGASLIANALYQEARQVYGDVERLVDDYPPGVFPRLDSARMNALLADYRTGVVGAEEAVDRQLEIVTSHKVEADPFYVENALAVYLALAGRHEEALRILDRLDGALIGSRDDPEPSMVYLIRANRCAVWFLSGDLDRARAEWSSLVEVVERIPYAFRSLLVRRHELISEVIARDSTMSPRAFDECLLRGPVEAGPLWDNFGRGFRMPEVEFWRDN